MRTTLPALCALSVAAFSAVPGCGLVSGGGALSDDPTAGPGAASGSGSGPSKVFDSGPVAAPAPTPPSSGGGTDGGVDAGPAQPGVDAASCAPIDAGGARLLSQVGLYADILSETLAPNVTEYEPAYALWADGAGKRRFAIIPQGTQIDSSDMDHWQFPVGTKFFKDFSLNGQRLETRLIARTADTGQRSDYALSSFIWTADGCDAVETTEGATDVLGTNHDVPSSSQCSECHGGEPGRILGFSAIQLSKTGAPPTLGSITAAGLLTAPPAAGVDYPVPGDAETSAALGYLHANCGHCHNPNGATAAGFLTMNLRLNVADQTPQATTIWTTTVNVPTQWFFAPVITDRVAGGIPSASAVPYRMNNRGNYDQMPPLGTKLVDSTGLATVQAWISALP